MSSLRVVLSVLLLVCFGQISHAQTLRDALSQAYEGSPQLNTARAALRVSDENLPQALSGKRPKINFELDAGYQSRTIDSPTYKSNTTGIPGGASLTADQTLYDGNRTESTVRRAEADVLVSRELLRTTEQDVLLLAVTSYMDVVRDSALLELRQNFITVIGEQVRSTQARFDAGELTRTDTAQARARESLAKAQLAAARAQLNASRANFRRFVGRDPYRLSGADSVDRLLPKTLEKALEVGSDEHPQIRSATYGIDSAAFAINIAEGLLLPTVTLEGTVSRRFDTSSNFTGGGAGGGAVVAVPGQTRVDTASVIGRVTIPIYDGGIASSQVRQGKELVNQRRLQVDNVRDQIRALIVANWGNLDAARAQVEATTALTSADQLALTGVREEAKVGQRTILDALNAEQEYLDAQVTGITAQRDRVVAAYALLGAVGRLNAQQLSLKVETHDPTLHYEQVRDKWFGLRTPEGQ